MSSSIFFFLFQRLYQEKPWYTRAHYPECGNLRSSRGNRYRGQVGRSYHDFTRSQEAEGGYASCKGRATATVSFTSHISTGYRSRPQSLSSSAARVVVAHRRRSSILSLLSLKYRLETVYHASYVIGGRQGGASGHGDCSDERSNTRCCSCSCRRCRRRCHRRRRRSE